MLVIESIRRNNHNYSFQMPQKQHACLKYSLGVFGKEFSKKEKNKIMNRSLYIYIYIYIYIYMRKRMQGINKVAYK
jgi:hypothetical protein